MLQEFAYIVWIPRLWWLLLMYLILNIIHVPYVRTIDLYIRSVHVINIYVSKAII